MSDSDGSAKVNIKDFGLDIRKLTVARIAKMTNKTERSVRAYLTKNGISCADYDGEARRAAVSARAVKGEEYFRIVSSVPDNIDGSATTLVNIKSEKEGVTISKNSLTATQALIENKKESDSTFEIVSITYGVIWIVLTILGFKEGGAAFFLLWLLMSFGFTMASMMTSSWLSDNSAKSRLNSMSEGERNNYEAKISAIRIAQNERLASGRVIDLYGVQNPNLICPHCQVKGSVRSKLAEEVTSTKIVPVIGNTIKARKKVTKMHCDHCSTTWNV